MKKRTIEQSIYYGAKPYVFEKAKELKKRETKAEKALWNKLKGKQLNGCKFRMQHPIERFIADFYCHEHKLVIEIDGSIHELPENKEYDIGRTEELEKYDIKVIRFTNQQVLTKINTVIETIKEHLK